MKRFLLFLLILTGGVLQAQNTNYTATNGPYGDTPTKIISCTSDITGALLSIKSGLGIYRSVDGGVTWILSMTGITNDLNIYDIYRDEVNNKIYALGYTRFYTSTDGGINWTTTATTGFTNGRFIARSPVTGFLFMVGGANSNIVYRSSNGGTTWSERITIGSTYLGVSDFDISSSGYLYISTLGNGVYRALEGDLSATQYSTAAGFSDLNITSLIMNGTDLYALSAYSGPYKSANGTTWSPILGTSPNNIPSCCFYQGKIEKDPSGNIYIFSYDKVWKTINGGTSWSSFSSPGTTNTYLFSPYFASNTTFFIGVQGISLYKTTNGGATTPTWTPVNSGFPGLIARQLLFTDNNRILYAGSSTGFHLSVDDGATWDFLNSGTTARSVIGFLKAGSTIYGYGTGLISTPSTDGATWTQVYSGTAAAPYSLPSLASNNGTTLFSSGTYNYTTSVNEFGLWKSINSGAGWTWQTVTGLPAINTSYFVNEDFFLDAAGTNIFARIYDYSVSPNVNSVYKINTTTGAATKITTITTTGSIYDIHYFNGKLYVLTSDNKLHISSDGGATWAIKTPPISYSEIKAISDNTLYIYGSGGIYISTDAGNNWTNTGTLDNKYAADISISSANYSYVATQYGPVYKSTAQVIPPNPPTALVVSGFSNSRVALRWADNSINESYFIIERSTGNNTAYDSIATVTNSGQTLISAIYLSTGLSASTTYYFRVRAASAAGKSAYTNEVSATTLVNNLATSAIPANRSWTGTTTNQSGVGIKTDPLVSITNTGSPGFYSVDKLTVGAAASVTQVSSPALHPEPASASFQENNGSVFMITANPDLSNGNGTWNSTTKTLTIPWQTRPTYNLRQETTVFTLNATDPAPASPSALAVYNNSSTSTYLSWTGAKFSAEYIIKRSTTTGTEVEIARVPYTSTTYVDAALTTGTKYYYTIVASNTWGQSAPSTEVSVTVQTTIFEPVQISSTITNTNILGSVWGDFDNDTWEDLIIPSSAVDQGPQAFRNKGDGTFEPMTLTNLTSDINSGRLGFTAGDYDNDGKVDLYISGNSGASLGTNKLWKNKGGSVFEQTQIFPHTATTYGGAFVDFNNDGLLDLSYTDWAGGTTKKPFYLYQQNPDHTFSHYELGDLGSDLSVSFSHSWADYDNDGDQDLLVEHGDDVNPAASLFYKNNGDGTFTKQTIAAFTTDAALVAESSSWADFDNDGDLDLFQGNFGPTATLNDMLYQNNGDGTFTRLTTSAPAEIHGLYTNGSAWGDVDNDGDIDLLVVRSPNNTLYLNNGNGTFTKYAGSESLTSTQQYDNSAAFADYNKDGFLDVYIQRFRNQPMVVLKNSKTSGKWIEFNLVGTLSNRSAVGARVTLNLPAGKKQIREVSTLTGFTSSNSLIVHFGLGTTTTIPSVTVRWPSGIIQTLTNVAANQILTVTEDGTGPIANTLSPANAATGVNGNTKLAITLNETSTAVASKTIKLFKTSDLVTPVASLAVTAASVSGNVFTFTLPQNLLPSTSYSVSVDAGAFVDGYGNASLAMSASSWQFTTTSGPVVSTLNPLQNATSVPIATKIEITFDKPPVAVAGKKLILTTGSTPQNFDATAGTISGNKVSFTPTSALTQFSAYTISVDAGAFTDANGNSITAIASSSWSFTTVDTTPPDISAFTPPATVDKGFTSSAAYKLTVTDNSNTVSSVTMSYRKVAGGTFTPLPGTLSGGTWNFAVLESFFDATGLEFYFTAKDPSNNTSTLTAPLPAAPGTNFFTYLNYKATATLPPDKIGFGGTKTSWKIFSIPFDLPTASVATIFDELTSTTVNSKAEFRLLTYKDATAWGEFPGDFSTFSRGKGYFVNIKTAPSQNITLPEAAAPANTRTNLFQMTLKKGWNQIGNPYLTAISWANVAAYSTNSALTGKGTELWKYTGSGYDKTSVDLQPFEGGFVFVDNDITVSIPFSGQTTSGGRVAQISSDLSQENWKVPFRLHQGDRISEFSGVGMNQEALFGMDDFDGVNPPRFFDYAEVNFPHAEHFTKNFAQDVVPTQKEYTWTFNVDSNVDGPAELSWDNTLFGENNKELFLFDITTQIVIDMRSENHYAFEPSVSKQFRVYYGENLHDKVSPDYVALGQPYPNPSAAKTTIPFRLPGQDASYVVSMEVYDMLGKKVATLAEGNYKSGFHSTTWNTEDAGLANGVYTVRFVVGGKSSTVLNKKVILKK